MLAQLLVPRCDQILGDGDNRTALPGLKGDLQKPSVIVDRALFQSLADPREVLKDLFEYRAPQPIALALGDGIHPLGDLAENNRLLPRC